MKKSKNLIALVIVLATVIAAYFAATAIAKKDEDNNRETVAVTGVTVLENNDKTVSTIAVSSEKYNYEIITVEKTHKLTKDESFPLDQSIASGIFSNVSVITAERVVSKDADLAEYGLDEPNMTAKLYYDDGNTVTLKIGDFSKESTCYYLSIDNEKTVYLVDEVFVSGFQYTEKALIDDEGLTVPEDGFDCVTDIKVIFADGKGYTYTYREDESIEVGEEGSQWWEKADLDGKVTEGDFADTANAVYKAVFNCKPDDWSAYNVTEEADLDKYGLKTPYVTVTVNYGETVSSDSVNKTVEKTATVIFGDVLPDSTESEQTDDDSVPAKDRYFMFGEGKIVYIVSEDDFKDIFVTENDK